MWIEYFGTIQFTNIQLTNYPCSSMSMFWRISDGEKMPYVPIFGQKHRSRTFFWSGVGSDQTFSWELLAIIIFVKTFKIRKGQYQLFKKRKEQSKNIGCRFADWKDIKVLRFPNWPWIKWIWRMEFRYGVNLPSSYNSTQCNVAHLAVLPEKKLIFIFI